jgi:hypothetical protein
LTVVKSPTMYRRVPSGDASTWRTCALIDGANDVMRLPVVMSYARRLLRGVSFVPAAAPPGGPR